VGDIVVISASGQKLLDTSYRPADSDVTGMRFIEEVQWVSERRLLVSGSIDPSTCEYVVVDATSGKEVDWFGTDGLSLAVSPDGAHVAYEAAIPHFMAEEDRRPRLCFDQECDLGNEGKTGYPLDQARHIEFATKPVWSASGRAVAALAQEYQSNNLFLIVRPLRGVTAEFALPLPPPDHGVLGYGSENATLYHVFWDGERVFVTAGEGTWKVEPGSGILVSVEPNEGPSDLATAVQLRRTERRRLHALGAREVNSWCESCPLRLLPRRQSEDEEVQDR
jgi:hypothetical protein